MKAVMRDKEIKISLLIGALVVLTGGFADLWRGGRALSTKLLGDAYEAAGREPPAPPKHLVTAMMALETGLSLQHYADPAAVPLTMLPELFDLLFGRLEP